MTEQEYQQRAAEFIGRLEHYPRVGQRPFGYPRGAWMMSGAWGILGILLQLPLLLGHGLERGPVIASIGGAILISCAFTMRVTAFNGAASGAMDRWLAGQIRAIEADSKPSA